MPKAFNIIQLFLCCFVCLIPAATTLAADFKVLPTSMEVSSLAITEDGRFVVLGHKASNQLSIWNIATQKIEKTVATETPGEILCRGEHVFIVNIGKGTVAVLNTKSWELTNQLEVPTADNLYLTAPQGRYFDDRILVTAYFDRQAKLFALDCKQDRCNELDNPRGRGPVTSSYTGKFSIYRSQSSSYAETKGSFDAIFRSESVRDFGVSYENAPLLRQVRENEFWFGGNKVFRGLPPKQMGDAKQRIVVPDQKQDCFYAVGPETVTCYAIDANLTELGHVRTSFPKEFDRMRPKPKSYVRNAGDADRKHVAVTIDKDTSIFVFSPTRGSVYHTRFNAISLSSPTEKNTNAEPKVTFSDEIGEDEFVGLPRVVAVGRLVESRVLPQDITKGKFSVIQGPKSIQIDTTGKLKWMPQSTEVGQHRVKVRAVVKGKTSFLRFNTSVVADKSMVPNVAPVAMDAASNFSKLPTPMFMSSMAITEDGDYLLLGHKASDKLSVWNVSQQEMKATVDCPSPGPILCRGSYTFVGNDGEGTITVIDNKTWKVTKTIDTGHRVISYMSAPQGKYFQGLIVVTTRIDSNDSKLTVVDTRRNRFNPIEARFWGEVFRSSYSGKSYITQSKSNGHIDAHGPFSAFVQSRPVQSFGNVSERSPLIEQVRDNEYWFGGKRVFRGLPPKPTPDEFGRFLIADQNFDVIYAMYPENIQCRALDGLMTDLGQVRTSYPIEYEEAQKKDPGGNGIAITKNGKLHLFVAAWGLGNVYYQALPQFSIPASIETSLLRTSRASAKPNEIPKHVFIGQLIEVPLVPEEMQRVYGTYELVGGPKSIQIDRRGNLTWTPTLDDVGRQMVRVRAKVRDKAFELRFSTLVHDPAVERAKAASARPDTKNSSKSTPRVWKDASGNFSITAVLVQFEAGIVTLRKSDGSEISVPAKRLSQQDQDFLAKQ